MEKVNKGTKRITLCGLVRFFLRVPIGAVKMESVFEGAVAKFVFAAALFALCEVTPVAKNAEKLQDFFIWVQQS